MDLMRVSRNRLTKTLAFLWLPLMVHSSYAEVFSIVVLPDTQFYSESNPAIFDGQTAWIDANKAARNIIYVAHMGDIVDSAGCNGGPTEWANADNSMDTLDGAAGIADDIPYGVMPGNHDFDPTTPGGSVCSSARTQYNANFGPARYPVAGTAWYGGSQDGVTNDNNFTLFSSPEGVDFIAINLAYSNQSGPVEAATLAWADARLKDYPNRIGIVTSHFIMTDGASSGDCSAADDLGTYGRAMWDALKNNPNLSIMLSGHCRGEKWITFAGGGPERPGCLGDVHGLMANYQNYNSNQSGYLRIMTFNTDTRTVSVETFSTELPGGGAAVAIGDPSVMNTTSVSNFEFDYDTTVSTCADVALTMDRSGSMNGASAAIAGTKLDALMNAADLFADQISFDERHRLAMVQFNSALVPFSVPEIPFDTLDAGNVGDAHDMVASISAGGSTNIIAGLQGGVNKIDVASPNDRSVVVLFTDGKHNTPSVLSDTALQTELNNVLTAATADMELYSLGFGTDISDVALSNIANSNGGWHVNEVDPIVVAKTFSLVAARVIEDQVLSDPLYVIKPGETRSHRVGVSRADRNLTLVTHWDRFDPERIRVRIAPSGEEDCFIDSASPPAAVKQAIGNNYRLFRIDLPYDCQGKTLHEGEWEVQMTASKQPTQPERVDILAYAASELKLNASVALVSGQLDIAAVLEGAVLKDAKFSAFLLPPLPQRDDSVRLDDLGSDPDGVSSIPPLELITREAARVPLEIASQGADSVRAKGSYGLDKKGLYQVRVVAEFIDTSGQILNREVTASIYSPTGKTGFSGIWMWIMVVIFVLVTAFLFARRTS